MRKISVRFSLISLTYQFFQSLLKDTYSLETHHTEEREFNHTDAGDDDTQDISYFFCPILCDHTGVTDKKVADAWLCMRNYSS